MRIFEVLFPATVGGTSQVKKRIESYSRVRVEGGGQEVVSQAGAVLLVETIRKAGLDRAISTGLMPWRGPRTVHDPGKILLDVALAVALGGDCWADVGMLRAEPTVFGPVASDPTVSRLIDTLATARPKALSAIRAARAEARERVWSMAKNAAPDVAGQVTVDLDGVLVLAHSEKQGATATWKKTFGHHPLMAFVDHGSGGSGEPVAGLLTRQRGQQHRRRPHHHHSTRAGPTAEEVPARTPDADSYRLRRRNARVRRLAREAGSVAVVLRRHDHHRADSPGRTQVPAPAWTAAVEPGGEIRDGAWVAEITGDCLKGWPKGMRLIVCKERPHPGAQLRITEADGLRLTCFATNTTDMPIAALELRHRQRARAEDRIRNARATGLRNLPLHDTAQNQIWLEIVQIALDLLAWMPTLALTDETRRWEPRRLRLRLFSAAARIVTTARRRHLRFARHWPCTDVITNVLARLEALPNPG
jgi:hypothetical protein